MGGFYHQGFDSQWFWLGGKMALFNKEVKFEKDFEFERGLEFERGDLLKQLIS